MNLLIEKRPLGRTGIELTCMGFGCASVWGKNLISDEQAQAIFEQAYELGIRYFDTGYSYGCAEKRIGKILKTSKIVKREEIVISTKFGTKNVNGKYVHDFTPDWMNYSVKTSLKRMGIEYVDLLLVHGPQIKDLTDEFLYEMKKLKQRGLVRAIGINTFDADVIDYVCEKKYFDFVMLDYNILRQEREPVISKLYQNGIGVVAGAPLAESLYSNRIFKIKKPKDIWYLARAFVNFREQLIKGRKYTFVNKIPGMSGSQVALNYVISNPHVTTAVFGTTDLNHLEENVRAKDITIPRFILERIKNMDKEKRRR